MKGKTNKTVHSSEIINTILELDHLLLTTPAETFLKHYVILSNSLKELYENLKRFKEAGGCLSSAHFVCCEREEFKVWAQIYFFIHQTAFDEKREDFQFLKALAKLRTYLFGGAQLIMEEDDFLLAADPSGQFPMPPSKPTSRSRIILHTKIVSTKNHNVPFLTWAVGLVFFKRRRELKQI
jgi:hypothetical protein